MDRETLQAICNRSALHRDLSVRLTPTKMGIRLEAEVPDRWTESEEPAHGGVLATLIDTATTFALISTSGHDWSTVDLRVDYLRPVRFKRIWVEAEAVHVGRTLGRATCRLGSETEAADALGVATLRRGVNLSDIT